MKVFRGVILDAPIGAVWATVRPFDGVANWNPGVTAARMETGTATGIGSIRHLDIADGSVFRETLLAHSDLERGRSEGARDFEIEILGRRQRAVLSPIPFSYPENARLRS